MLGVVAVSQLAPGLKWEGEKKENVVRIQEIVGIIILIQLGDDEVIDY